MIPKVGPLLRSVSPTRALGLAALGALCLWVYWPTLEVMGRKWLHDPQYSHGYLVPVFAAGLLWSRRSRLPAGPLVPRWWGLPLVAAGVLMRLAGTYVYFDWLDAASLLPCLAGLGALLGGRPVLRWSWPSLAFLLLMIPLPYRLETALSHPLQNVATWGSTYLMQTLGLPALAEGNVIVLNRGRIGVSEACNGLSMMLVFFAFATGLAIVLKRPWPDKVVILLSAAPVAVLANVLRITVTGLAQELWSPQVAQSFFHDWAGWLMMPAALGLLWGELWLLGRALVPRAPSAPPPPRLPLPAPAAARTNGKPQDRPRREAAASLTKDGRQVSPS